MLPSIYIYALRCEVHARIYVCIYLPLPVPAGKGLNQQELTNNASPPSLRSFALEHLGPSTSPFGEEEREKSLRPGLNRGPSVYKTDALPLSYAGVPACDGL